VIAIRKRFTATFLEKFCPEKTPKDRIGEVSDNTRFSNGSHKKKDPKEWIGEVSDNTRFSNGSLKSYLQRKAKPGSRKGFRELIEEASANSKK
jgi:hypothetical protein